MTLLTTIGPVFYKLVYMSLTGLAAGAIVLLLRRLADKRFSPFWKYAMWLLVLAALVVPWRPQSRTAVFSPAEAVQDISFRDAYSQAQAEYSAVLAQEPQLSQASLEVEAARKVATSLRAKTLAFDELLPLLWLCGMAGATSFMGITAIRLRRRIKRAALTYDMTRYEALLARCQESLGIKRRVRIVLQSHVGTPALLGLLRPMIMLPEYAVGMGDERLEYVILHELSHLRRGDGLVNSLLLALRAVYWFNPLVWLLFRYVREDMELANDSAVLRGMGQDEQKKYSLSLVEVLMGCATQKSKHTMLCMTDGKKNIERRIGMIQLGEFFKKRKWVIAVAGVLVIAGIAALFLTTGMNSSEIKIESALERRVEEIVQDRYAYYLSEQPGFLISAVKIHGAYRQNGVTKVFVTAWTSAYSVEGNEARETSGSVVPAAISFRENLDGGFEYKEASDGGQFASSIRQFCKLPSGQNIRGLAQKIIDDYTDHNDLEKLHQEKLDAYLAAHGLRLLPPEWATHETDFPPLTLEQSVSQAILQSYDGLFNAELHRTLLVEEADGLTNVFVGYEAAQLGWKQGAFAVQSASGSVGIFRFSRDKAGVYTLEDAEYDIEFANDHAEWKEKTGGLKDSEYSEMPRNIIFGYGENEYWVKGTMVGKYLPEGVFSQKYMPDFKEIFGSDGTIVYYWSKSEGEGETLSTIRKIELELCDESVARYHFKDYGFDDGYVYPTANLSMEQAGKLAADYARDFWQDGDKLKLKHTGEGAVSLYDPGNIENWQAERGGKTYNVMVDLPHGAVIYADAGETRLAAPEPTTRRDTGNNTMTATPNTTRPDLALNRQAEKDGLMLRVNANSQYPLTGEPFTLTATITNTTGHDITYGVGSGTPNVHLEIQVRIPGFIDLDLEGKMWTEDYRFATLKAGETFTETIRFSSGELPAEEYEGTAVFTYYTGTGENPGEAKRLELKFPVILV